MYLLMYLYFVCLSIYLSLYTPISHALSPLSVRACICILLLSAYYHVSYDKFTIWNNRSDLFGKFVQASVPAGVALPAQRGECMQGVLQCSADHPKGQMMLCAGWSGWTTWSRRDTQPWSRR